MRKRSKQSSKITAAENARKTSHTLLDECVEPCTLKGIAWRMKPWQHVLSKRWEMRETEIDCSGWKRETDQLRWICTSAGWSSTLKTVRMLSGYTINTHTHTVSLLLLQHLKHIGERQILHQRLEVDIYGTQHFSSEVSKRLGAHKPPGRNTNVARALSRSKLNPHLLVKLSKSNCTFGKWNEEKWAS